ncbi:MAG: cysteine desulfurase family protein [Candidatus Paceibacterota bacterium]|jgi:cysteine desulfurase
MLGKKKIYLDHAGATPIDKRVARTVAFYERKLFANPNAIHEDGVKVRGIIEEARSKIAKQMNAHSDEIIFTGSGTESIALALLGLIKNYEPASAQGGLRIKNEKSEYKIPHIITTEIEHPAVLENCKMLKKEGRVEVTYIGVDENGIINLEELKNSLKENTVLVSVMYANNEIGTIEPIQEIAKIIRHFKKSKMSRSDLDTRVFSSDFPVFHTDACQAMNYLFTENIEKLGVDLMSFNSSKIYGPKGIGVLYKKRGVELSPLYGGGGQEFGLRSGTESVSLIKGVAMALGIVNKMKEKESKRLTAIRDYGIKKLLSLSDTSGYKIILNGDVEVRLPNNINISVSGISSELLVIELSARGIFVSEKSACKSDDDSASYVIGALRRASQKNVAGTDGSIRISLGRCNKMSDMDVLYKGLKDILEKYKKWK